MSNDLRDCIEKNKWYAVEDVQNRISQILSARGFDRLDEPVLDVVRIKFQENSPLYAKRSLKSAFENQAIQTDFEEIPQTEAQTSFSGRASTRAVQLEGGGVCSGSDTSSPHTAMEEIKELNALISELKDQVETQRKELSSLKLTLDVERKQLAGHKAKINREAEKKIEELEVEIERLKQKQTTLLSENSEAMRRVHNLCAEWKCKAEKSFIAEEEISIQFEKFRETSKTDMAEMRRDRDEVLEKYHSLLRKGKYSEDGSMFSPPSTLTACEGVLGAELKKSSLVVELERLLEAKQEENERLVRTLQRVNEELTNINLQTEKYKSQAFELSEEVKTLQMELERSERERDSAVQQLHENLSTKGQQNHDVNQLKIDLEKTRNQLFQLEAEQKIRTDRHEKALADKAATILKLESCLKSYKEDVVVLESEKKKNNERSTELENWCTHAEEEIENLRRAATRLRSTFAPLARRLGIEGGSDALSSGGRGHIGPTAAGKNGIVKVAPRVEVSTMALMSVWADCVMALGETPAAMFEEDDSLQLMSPSEVTVGENKPGTKVKVVDSKVTMNGDKLIDQVKTGLFSALVWVVIGFAVFVSTVITLSVIVSIVTSIKELETVSSNDVMGKTLLPPLPFTVKANQQGDPNDSPEKSVFIQILSEKIFLLMEKITAHLMNRL
eukprot:GDKK01051817.1.p1 GENE.GDKK01051817.1~~GDKK01051817.1.p1  ORF type:complete len:765 (+),score=184.78 GDKK01051817.1:277-2295(+)